MDKKNELVTYRLTQAEETVPSHYQAPLGNVMVLQAPACRKRKDKEMSEVFFLVDEELEGGYSARALGVSIFTQAETVEELYARVRDAVECHFDVEDMPKAIRLHFVREELIAV